MTADAEILEIVIGAIGGDLEPGRPFAACGRNTGLLPRRDRFEAVCSALRAFCTGSAPEADADPEVLAALGPPTPTKRWLAASLDKTIRLQLDPHEELNVFFFLPGPSWIRQPDLAGGHANGDG